MSGGKNMILYLGLGRNLHKPAHQQVVRKLVSQYSSGSLQPPVPGEHGVAGRHHHILGPPVLPRREIHREHERFWLHLVLQHGTLIPHLVYGGSVEVSKLTGNLKFYGLTH